MSTKATTITYNTIEGTSVRSVNVLKRKYYFISDLTKVYGRGFVSKLPSTPIILRIKDGSVSQDRRLVNATEFKQTIRQIAQPSKVARNTGPKSTKVTFKKTEAEQFTFDFETKTSKTTKQPIGENLRNLQIDLSDVRDVDAVELSLIKGQINALVNNYVHSKAVSEGWTDEQLEQNDREKYREVYTALYREFDRVLRKQLGAEGKNLEDYNLGTESRKHRQNYLDMVGKQGLLPQFLNVAKQMFGYKLAKTK